MMPEGPWRGRGATLEAVAWLLLARLLIARVAFGRWRGWLGTATAPQVGDRALQLPANLPRRRLARAVERAAARLPGESLCLPRAMALQWMLRRRKLGGILHIGVLPGRQRGSLDDLHAWVTCFDEVLIGADVKPYSALFAAANPGAFG